MIVTFLGTGTSQGVPVIACDCEVCQSLDYRDKRLRTSIHIEANGKSLVMDAGPDFRQQMLRERIKQLDAIIFTHEHKDHTAGLDDVRAFNFSQRKDIPIYGRKQVIEQLKQEFAYIFASIKYPGVPQLEINYIENKAFNIGDVTISPIDVRHYKLPVFGFRIGDFSYVTDTNHISEIEKEKIKGSKVLVLDALQKKEHISHFTLKEALALIEELQPEQAYLIHISHRMGLHASVSKELPANVALAHDGLRLTI